MSIARWSDVHFSLEGRKTEIKNTYSTKTDSNQITQSETDHQVISLYLKIRWLNIVLTYLFLKYLNLEGENMYKLNTRENI